MRDDPNNGCVGDQQKNRRKKGRKDAQCSFTRREGAINQGFYPLSKKGNLGSP